MVRRLLLGGLVVFVLLALGWVGWQAWHVNRSLTAASSDATALQQALSDGDDSEVDQELGELQDHAADASDRTSGRTWSLLTHLPVFGDDARGVRLVSHALVEISGPGIEPLAESAADLEALLPHEGRVPLDRLEELRDPVEQASGVFARVDRDLGAEDPDAFVRPLAEKYRELAEKVSSASDALSKANTALQVMPSMLGADGPRDYLLVFQNNAEIRATGGLPGAVSLLHAEDGALTLTRQVAGQDFKETPQPVLPLTPAEELVYGEQLGTYFLDANFTPDFPRTAELMKAHWERVHGDGVDGVLSLDPVALSYLLEATGPVQVGEVSLTADDVVDELLHQTYVRYADPRDQDTYFRQVARDVFAEVTSGGSDVRVMLDALERSASEHRLLVHSFAPAEDEVLSRTVLDGALVTEPTPEPQVSVTLNDTTGAKMSYFLRYSVSVDATSCLRGVQTLSGKTHLESQAPADAATSLPDYVTGGGQFGIAPGSQLVTLRLYAPVGGSIDAISVNSEPVQDIGAVDADGRQVATVYVLLEPQRTTDLTWSMTGGPDQTKDVEVSVTPGLRAGSSSSVVRSAC